ncbi:MAG: hypothetical protein WD824_05915 [Cyclobacteriaceae bacterium]
MFEIGSIEKHRNEKFLSLFSNKVDREVHKLRSILDELGFSVSDRESIDRQIQFALEQDYGPLEIDRYYVCHPIRVACFSCLWQKANGHKNNEMIIAALVHNILERNVITFDDLKKNYPGWVSETIITLTPNRENIKTKEGMKSFYSKIYEQDIFVNVLKFLDKLDNIYALCIQPSVQIRNDYWDETMTYVRPIGEKYFPLIIPYFDRLVESTKSMGFYKPEFN